MRLLYLSVIVGGLGLSWPSDGLAQGIPSAEKQAERFLTAIQKKDFKTIFDASHFYQTELAHILASNPKVLSQKLTTEYYEAKRRALFNETETFPQAYIRQAEAVLGAPSDPAPGLRALMSLLAPSSQRKVIESKREARVDMWSGRTLEVFVVYVSVVYNAPDESPLLEWRLLKEGILVLVLDAKTGWYMGSALIKKGNVFWGKLRPKIINVTWRAEDLSGLRLSMHMIGGAPPYQSMSRCGPWLLERMKEAETSSSDDFDVTVELRKRLPDEAFPIPCAVTITDSAGQTDTVSFESPKWFTGVANYRCWAASPWREWGQAVPESWWCMKPILALRASKEPVVVPPGMPVPEITPQAPTPSAPDVRRPSEGSRMAALTRDIPDVESFHERAKVFDSSFDDVWSAAQHALSRTSLLKRQADRIVTMDRDNGVLVTAPTTHSRLLGESFRRQLAILIERVTVTATRVTVKGLCYDQRGMNEWTRWDPDRCSDGFIQELEKALAGAGKR